jgi:hypothetical protein
MTLLTFRKPVSTANDFHLIDHDGSLAVVAYSTPAHMRRGTLAVM